MLVCAGIRCAGPRRVNRPLASSMQLPKAPVTAWLRPTRPCLCQMVPPIFV